MRGRGQAGYRTRSYIDGCTAAGGATTNVADLRCPKCNHVYAIHSANGLCPRWTNPRLSSGTRVCIRIAHKWPDAEGHTLAYFADCVDGVTGMVLVWDLTSDARFEAPTLTVRVPWTRTPSTREKQDAADDLELRMGERVAVLRNLS